MTEFTPIASLFGGALIGLSAVLLMALHGRIAGMTGILTGIIPPLVADWTWRAAFLAGAVLTPILILGLTGTTIAFDSPTPMPWLIVGGLVVGMGVHFGGGCPSGHSVCGISRLSWRSIAATFTFMATATVTVFIIRHVIGGV